VKHHLKVLIVVGLLPAIALVQIMSPTRRQMPRSFGEVSILWPPETAYPAI
jgi:hypothetical protein